MKIYSLLLVKNECDVIEASLLDACRWSDKVIVIDKVEVIEVAANLLRRLHRRVDSEVRAVEVEVVREH